MGDPKIMNPKQVCDKIRSLSRFDYINIINSFYNNIVSPLEIIQKIIVNRYDANHRVTTKITLVSSNLFGSHSDKNYDLKPEHDEFLVIRTKNYYYFHHVYPSYISKIINNNPNHKLLFWLIRYKESDEKYGHIGSVCYDTQNHKMYIIDPNGKYPFYNFINRIMITYAMDLSIIMGFKITYIITCNNISYNFWDEYSIFGKGICSTINLYLIYKIIHDGIKPDNLDQIYKQFNKNSETLKSDILRFLILYLIL